MHFLLSVEHLVRVCHSWHHAVTLTTLNSIAILIVDKLVIFALHCRVKALIGDPVRASCHGPTLRVRTHLRADLVTRVSILHRVLLLILLGTWRS